MIRHWTSVTSREVAKNPYESIASPKLSPKNPRIHSISKIRVRKCLSVGPFFGETGAITCQAKWTEVVIGVTGVETNSERKKIRGRRCTWRVAAEFRQEIFASES